MIMALGRKEPLPEPEVIRKQLGSGQALNDKGTVGEWLDTWLSQEKGKHATSTENSYESHVRLYLKPKIGHIRRDRLNIGDLIEMFNSIADDNDKIEAANADRRANIEQAKQTRKRAEWRRLKAERDAMPPFRRPVRPSSQHAILRTLRASLNDAIKQKRLAFNPAAYHEMTFTKPKPIIWTDERVKRWRKTGQRPGPVMVWTPTQEGEFLDYVAEHDPEYEAMWHLFLKRGLRRGEVAGLPWTETQLDGGVIEITVQRTESFEVEEGDPKSEAGKRTLPLDDETVTLVRVQEKRQEARKQDLGDAWVDSGKVFTREDGSPLRPSWISDRFQRLNTAAGLPPIRLHDTRHTAATSMLAAGTDMKVVQETLGHSTLGTTSDIYTSVLPEVARAAADAVAALIPRRAPAKTPGHPLGTHASLPESPPGGGEALS